ncbi:MAG: hypothetical protein FWG10_11070 [Eubacteriaceae bacterium]|nr:hypothetical protein [Eubacteriaceae bacterium]
MSISTLDAYSGARQLVSMAGSAIEEAISIYSHNAPFEQGDSVYPMALIHAFTGESPRTLGDLSVFFRDKLEKPSLDTHLSALQTIMVAEIYNCLKGNAEGFIPDYLIRSSLAPICCGEMPAIGLLIGEESRMSQTAALVSLYDSIGVVSLLSGKAAALHEGPKQFHGTLALPIGVSDFSCVNGISFAARAALFFGKIAPGDKDSIILYVKERLPVFINSFGSLNLIEAAIAFASAQIGFTIIEVAADSSLEQISRLSLAACPNAKLPREQMPAPFSAAYLHEEIKNPVYESASALTSFLAVSRDPSKIFDGYVTVIGEELGESKGAGRAFACVAEFSGYNVAAECEELFEGKIRDWLSQIKGVMINDGSIAISQEAFEGGLNFKLVGECVLNKMRQEYSGIINQLEITILTDFDKCRDLVYTVVKPLRQLRKPGLEDTLFKCFHCKDLAPGQSCVISANAKAPCGFLGYRDARALSMEGPAALCQPIEEEEGMFGINYPLPNCGSGELYCQYDPSTGGVFVFAPGIGAIAPNGLDCNKAAMTPGSMPISKEFLLSNRFLETEGGIKRIVWMPGELKEEMGAGLDNVAIGDFGIENFTALVCDETIAASIVQLASFLEGNGHPIISLEKLQ